MEINGTDVSQLHHHSGKLITQLRNHWYAIRNNWPRDTHYEHDGSRWVHRFIDNQSKLSKLCSQFERIWLPEEDMFASFTCKAGCIPDNATHLQHLGRLLPTIDYVFVHLLSLVSRAYVSIISCARCVMIGISHELVFVICYCCRLEPSIP